MRIKAMRNFTMPGIGGFKRGEEYDVTDKVGDIMLKRELAEKVAVKAPETTKSDESSEESTKKSNKKSKK